MLSEPYHLLKQLYLFSHNYSQFNLQLSEIIESCVSLSGCNIFVRLNFIIAVLDKY